jgi:hypothetical protein
LALVEQCRAEFNLSFAARAIHDYSRASPLNGKILTTARAVETDVHAEMAGFGVV